MRAVQKTENYMETWHIFKQNKEEAEEWMWAAQKMKIYEEDAYFEVKEGREE